MAHFGQIKSLQLFGTPTTVFRKRLLQPLNRRINGNYLA